MKNLIQLLIFFCAGCFWVSAKKAKPNVLFIMSDDLNTALSGFGHPQCKTPELDRLASRGMRFENMHCQYPVCGASRASLMSGLYPYTNGTLGNAGTLRGNMPNVVTMSQMFRNNGYRVGRVSKIYHMGIPPEILAGTATRDDPHSWDEVVNIRAPEQYAPGEKTNWSPKNKGSQSFTGVVAEGDDLAHADGMAANHAIDFLKRHKDKPFFLACGFVRPHVPLVAPAKYFDRYDRDAMIAPVVPENDLEDVPEIIRDYKRNSTSYGVTPELHKGLLEAYYASISYMDAQVGRVLDALEELGLSDNTIVVFTSDHGYLLGEHDKFQKQHLFEESTRVPFIVRVPWMNKHRGKATKHITELIDLYPTLADLSGLKAPKNLQGQSMLPLLKNPSSDDWKKDLAFTISRSGGESIRTHDWRFTQWGFGAKGMELYDLRKDPGEFTNLAGDPNYDKPLKKLKAQLEAKRADAGYSAKRFGGHPAKPYGGPPPTGTPKDDPDIGQLFNISNDPFEKQDLWESHPEIVKKLRHELQVIQSKDKSDSFPDTIRNDIAGSPNVVLIFSDDMGYSDLPKFGKSEIPTPNIDRLAQEGTLFTDAYVTAPICVASRMGLLTGQYQQRFGIYCNMYGEARTRLFLKQTLLPAVFQDAGYRTAHVGKWHLSGNKRTQYETAGPRDRGFDESVAIRGGDSAFWKGTPVFRNGKEFPAPEYLTDLWGTEACAFIDRAHAQPFFLYLAYNAVHSPMHALDADQAKFPKVEDENRRIYDGMLLAMDRSIGRVLDRLDKHGIAENTIVVFMNDNGGGGSTGLYAGHSRNYANNKPLRGHKFDVLEGGVRVPLIIRWPKLAPVGKVYREMVSSTDVFPTLVASAGLQMPKGQPADGVDLLPFINGKNTSKPHEWLCWQNRSWLPRKKGGYVVPTPKVHNSAIRKGNWKLVRMNEKIGSDAPPPAWKLYDLKKDIGEQNDLSKQHGDVVKELGAQFNKWRSSMHPTVE